MVDTDRKINSLNENVVRLFQAKDLLGAACLELVLASQRQECQIEELQGQVQELQVKNDWLRKAVDNLLFRVYGPDFIQNSELFD